MYLLARLEKFNTGFQKNLNLKFTPKKLSRFQIKFIRITPLTTHNVNTHKNPKHLFDKTKIMCKIKPWDCWCAHLCQILQWFCFWFSRSFSPAKKFFFHLQGPSDCSHSMSPRFTANQVILPKRLLRYEKYKTWTNFKYGLRCIMV